MIEFHNYLCKKNKKGANYWKTSDTLWGIRGRSAVLQGISFP